MKKLTLFFILSILLIPASGCYAHGPWRGKVIDAETKQPIEGAAVVAVWEKHIATGVGTATYFLAAEETVTNKDGEFKSSSKIFLSIPGIRQIKGPFFTIYKPGYGAYYDKGLETKSVVELPKLNTKKDRDKAVDDATSILAVGKEDALGVPRSKVPNLIRLINKENRYLGFKGEIK